MKTCCFTGPRTFKLGFEKDSDPRCVELKKKINNEIGKLYQRGFTNFLSGMAEGVDIYCAEAVIELKKTYKDVTLTAVFPYNHKGKDREEKERDRLVEILRNTDKVITLQENYSPGCFYKRNRYMVDNSDLLFAVYNNTGGTAYTIKYAADTNKPIKICP